MLDITGPAAAGAAKTVAVTPAVPVAIRPAHAPSESGRDIIIAVDAGHGGVDPGASGRRGTREKDVVLEVARALAARINQEPGMKAVLTRDGDYFISLQERTLRARRAKADLFVSIHADAIANPDVSGSSVYVLSDRGATSEAARWLAERENAADLKGGIKLDDKDPVLRGVLLDLSQTASISASMVAADNVLKSLDRIGEVRKPQRAAGGIRGAQVARYSLDAGGDRLHLQSRRRAQTRPARASRQAGQRDFLRNRAVLSGQCARRHAPGGRAAQRRRRHASRNALGRGSRAPCALNCAASCPGRP